MEIRCRFANRCVRAAPYASTLPDVALLPCKSTTADLVNSAGASDVCIPKHLLCGAATAGDLAAFLAGSLGVTTPDGVLGNAFGIVVDGFVVPDTEPLMSGVIREHDDVELRWSSSVQASHARHFDVLLRVPAGMPSAQQVLSQAPSLDQGDATVDQRTNLTAFSPLVEECGRRIQVLERQQRFSADESAVGSRSEAAWSALLEDRDQHIQALKRQVAKLTRQLAKACPVVSASSTSTTSVNNMCSPLGRSPLGSSASSWRAPNDGEDLLCTLVPGTVIRYRLELVDPWHPARLKRSPRREATAVGRLEGSNETLLLKHVGGAMDCVEVSRLFDVEIRDSPVSK